MLRQPLQRKKFFRQGRQFFNAIFIVRPLAVFLSRRSRQRAYVVFLLRMGRLYVISKRAGSDPCIVVGYA